MLDLRGYWQKTRGSEVNAGSILSSHKMKQFRIWQYWVRRGERKRDTAIIALSFVNWPSELLLEVSFRWRLRWRALHSCRLQHRFKIKASQICIGRNIAKGKCLWPPNAIMVLMIRRDKVKLNKLKKKMRWTIRKCTIIASTNRCLSPISQLLL